MTDAFRFFLECVNLFFILQYITILTDKVTFDT